VLDKQQTEIKTLATQIQIDNFTGLSWKLKRWVGRHGYEMSLQYV
jgi:hypothetical protein